MKILLVEPAKSAVTVGGEDVFVFEPLALEYLAAAVAPHHDVRILDLRVDPSLDDTLDAFQPDIVGITGYTVHVNPVRALCRHIKAWDPAVLTVIGGHHATVAPEDFISTDIDLVVKGDGIAPLRSIVARHERGRGFGAIPGVGVREADRLAWGPPQPIGGLDEAPVPLRALTAAYRHHYFCEWMKPLASMRTSKGCPFRCSFCAQWKVAQGRYLRRSVDVVVQELASIEEESVFFADDESLVDVQRMRTLADRIRSSGIRKRLFMYGRSDTIANNPDLLEAWREAGLERVFVGLESFRDDDLKLVRKGSSIDDNARAVRVLSDLGIDIYASFIVRPEFEHADFASLRRYCRDLGLDFATFAVLTPLPGTDLYQEVEESLLTQNPDFFDFVHTVLPTALPLDEFFGELTDLYRNAVPLGRQLSLLKKFPLDEWPALFGRSSRTLRRLRSLSHDYAQVA